MYLRRTLQNTIKRVNQSFPVVLITGPRQVGKTTLFQELQKNERRYVTLDDSLERALAQEEPALFLQNYPPPILIDEIQYAPQLFPYIKMAVDKERKPGMFWLTGSQQFDLMKNVAESLAGRVGILNLLGFSLPEEMGQSEKSMPFLPGSYPTESKPKSLTLPALYQKIWRGSFPFLVAHGTADWEVFYKSYVQTYLQRDIRDFARISHERAFLNFLRAAAARTGQLINYADLASDVSVSETTIKSWLTILRACGLIYILEPYHTNITKRLVKTAKLYFLDTGLCSYLSGWSSAQVLERGAMSGAIFETFAVVEIIKSYWHNGKEPPIFFYRDRDKVEIDLLIEHDGRLYPVEIKKTAKPDKESFKNFSALNKLSQPIGPGAVVCSIDQQKKIGDNVDAFPISLL
jgi:predicted AAA+ superfamily ATPase